jgi:hypothetical protein
MAILVLNSGTPEERSVNLDKPSVLMGCAPDVDVTLAGESVAGHHVRIEHKPDGYYLICLEASGGVEVNGVVVTFQRLNDGDTIQVGEDTGMLVLGEEDLAAQEPPPPPAAAMMPAIAGSTAPTIMHHGPSMCPRCGAAIPPGYMACMHCGYQFSNLPAMPLDYVPPMAGQIGAGVLPVIAFLAALSVVGAPIALVLGLMCLSIIRRRGGTVRDRALAKWAIGLGFMWMVLGGVGAYFAVQHARESAWEKEADGYEGKVIDALKNLACAQKYAHTIEFYDTNEDGEGEYAQLGVLEKMGSSYFDADLADGEAYGYKFTIREVSSDQFLAVAEPTTYDVTGKRTFSITQNGKICGKDVAGVPYGKIESMLPILPKERSAFFEVDDEIAQDVLSYVKTLSNSLADQEKAQRILRRLREDYALTTVGRELEGLTGAVDQEVTEMRATVLYMDVKDALAAGEQDMALAKLQEIVDKHPSYSGIAAVERQLDDLRAEIAQQREQKAQVLFAEAEALERSGDNPEAVVQLFDRIEKLYPETTTASRIASLRPQLQRQMREYKAEDIFSDLMELSPEKDYEEILNRANQLQRNYNDTDLFAKVEVELLAKVRKARASFWRGKTEENMAAGRMRGALAQLEAATRENEDLRHDLRDLYIVLYRSVASTLMEEGDARQALMYYEELRKNLQAAGSTEQVDSDMLAKLHNDVGQADYGLKKYKEALWHFTSAAWKYQDDAPFNTRLGAANLYNGLYRPAEKALGQALEIREDMSSARMYRAYLNLRVVAIQERVIASGFMPDDAVAAEMAQEEEDDDNQTSAQPIMIFALDDADSEDGEITVNSTSTQDTTVAGPASLDIKSSGLRGAWFTQFAASTPSSEEVPNPSDIDLFMNFRYYASGNLALSTVDFLEELELQELELTSAKASASMNTESSETRRGTARAQGNAQVEVSRRRNVATLRTQLRELRTLHVEDVESREELFALMSDMKARLKAAVSDMKAAGEFEPRLQSVTENVVRQISEKIEAFSAAERLLSKTMDEEVDMRDRMLELGEKMIAGEASTYATKRVERFQENLFDEDTAMQISPALGSLRDALDTRLDLNSVLRAASGDTQATGAVSTGE